MQVVERLPLRAHDVRMGCAADGARDYVLWRESAARFVKKQEETALKKGRGNQIVRMALGVLGYEAAFGVFGFLMMPLATDAAAGVRIGVSALVIAGAWALVFFGAAVRGERDCAVSQMLDKLRAQGMQEKARSEENKRFWRMKAVWAALLGGAPLLLVASLWR